MIETLETGITSPALPTLAEIERRTEELLAQPSTPTRHATHVTDPASPEMPTSEPRQQPKEPQHTLRSIFDEYALYGLAGEAVRTLAPHTEAQPEAILLQLLAAFGNVIGPSPHCMVGPTRHALNLFVVLVGESSKARKGTSWNQVARLFAEVDPASTENRVTSARLTTHGLMAVMGHQAGDRRLLSSPRNSPPCFTPWAAAAPRYLPCCAALGMAQPCACSTVTASSMPARTSQLVGHITLRELALRAI